jgi:hypothetical protein
MVQKEIQFAPLTVTQNGYELYIEHPNARSIKAANSPLTIPAIAPGRIVFFFFAGRWLHKMLPSLK